MSAIEGDTDDGPQGFGEAGTYGCSPVVVGTMYLTVLCGWNMLI